MRAMLPHGNTDICDDSRRSVTNGATTRYNVNAMPAKAKLSPDPNEYHEGPSAVHRFDDALRKVLSVGREEMNRRLAAYEKDRKSKRRKSRKP